ncbi:MAG TPA: NYN domain-containing protein [Anaerolineales bacterium]|jgi:predicted RNA-binding protein with PIN domain|nr:NYN domain-containing protein [Anaerolineales bacterium]
MPYLIDGHNLIGKIPSLNLDDLDDEKELIQLLQRYCQETGKDAEVYFDHSASGHARAQVHGRVTARFVRSRETADQAMARHLKRLGNAAANWTVVSSDREVLASAKRSRARILSSEDFSQELIAESTSAGSADSPTISEDEIDDWLKLFGDGNSTES